jgi:nitrite reductase/ring-hydroxylating ferredoxin subunit
MNSVPPPDTLTPPDELTALGEWIDGLIQDVAAYPDDGVRARVFALLDGVDALHRAALARLVTILQAPGAEAIWAQARDDRVIRTVLLLYDLAPPDAPTRKPPGPAPLKSGSEALRGKRILPMIAARPGPAPAPVAAPMAVPAPAWYDVTALDDVPPGALRGFQVAGDAVLLCNVGGDVFAYHDACPDSPLVLSIGQLDGDEIVCPWHGCRFDARGGQRRGHRGTGLTSLPVATDGPVVRVAVAGPAAMATGGQPSSAGVLTGA